METRVDEHRRAWRALRAAAVGAVVALYAANAGADEAAEKNARWHLHGSLGYAGAGGDYGDFMEKPIQWELGIARSSKGGAWRFGGGLQFGSLNLKPSSIPPGESRDQEETAHFETFLSATRVFNPRSTFRPYLQGRVG